MATPSIITPPPSIRALPKPQDRCGDTAPFSNLAGRTLALCRHCRSKRISQENVPRSGIPCRIEKLPPACGESNLRVWDRNRALINLSNPEPEPSFPENQQ